MSIKLIVAVTDNDWFDYLSRRPNLDEINFWSPSPKAFRALQPGELFLFKLHAPHNAIVGGGVFSGASTLPWSLAWDAFGEANGVPSAIELRHQVEKYRRERQHGQADFEIGCRILTRPFYFEKENWISLPSSWKRNIVSFKTYDTGDAEGRDLWHSVMELLKQKRTWAVGESPLRFGAPHLIQPRLGQGAFRTIITHIYDRRCAVTQERTLPALEAAHIRPYHEGGEHKASNGLLLRRDIHNLFDTGYVTVTPELRLEVSRRIREEFENGKEYYGMHGRRILVPSESKNQPNRDALTWHNENCFRK